MKEAIGKTTQYRAEADPSEESMDLTWDPQFDIEN